jgi:hypothetical protein
MNIDKDILEVVNDFASWKGNSYTLAALIVAKHLELMKAKLEANGFPEAAEAL